MAPTKKQLQKSANILVGCGFLLYILGIVASQVLEGLVVVLAVLVILGALAMFVIGCMRYALSKGYNQWLGLIGLGGLVGLIVLAVLPDKWVDVAPPVDSPTNYPRYPQG